MDDRRIGPILVSGVGSMLLCIGFLLPLSQVGQLALAGPAVWYVAPSGSGTLCSQSHPCSLQTALSAAVDGDTVRVSQGTYYQTVTLNKSIVLEGGWNTSFTHRDWDAYVTILDAQRSGSVIQVHGTVSPTIEGFVITGGDGSGHFGWGGGIRIGASNAVIEHNTIISNVACLAGGCGGTGGGIMIGKYGKTILSGPLPRFRGRPTPDRGRG